MCGIVGIFEYGLTSGGVDAAEVARMRDTLVHRGPDGEGLYLSPDRRVGLGHRRLAIVDIEHGAQPMVGEAAELLVFNGEIYNYPALRRELEAEGVRFETNCDTEIILKLYTRHGVGCLDRLNGMFAFALWDPKAERLFFARDRIGEKPLYWSDQGGRLIFGSEIKALLAHHAVTAAVNDDAIVPYLTNLVSSSPDTLYRGIGKLPPGHYGICDAGGVRIDRYWSVFEPREWRPAGRAEATEKVRSLLDASVHDRLMSDVPVGVLLSGGLDSTTLVALLAERAAELSTFSVGFDDHPALDERAEAARVARHFGTPHHEIVLTQRTAMDFLPKLVHHQDEPLGDPVCLPLNFVCGLAREHGVKVVLAGEGADELFWGYPAYKNMMARWPWMRRVLSMPAPLRGTLPRLVSSEKHPFFRETLQDLASGRPLPMHMPLGLTEHHRNLVLADASVNERSSGWSPTNGRRESTLDALAFDTQEYEFGLRLPELLLMRIDRFSMANSVEARVPFLDPELVEYVYRLPLEHKLRDGIGKVVMRDAVSDVVPQWVLDRKKKGFGAPVIEWLRDEMGPLFAELLDSEGLRERFDVDTLRAAVAGGDGNAKLPLWPVMNFALWHRYWIEDEPLEPLMERVRAAAAR